MEAKLTFSTKRNCVHIETASNLDFTPLVDEIVNWTAPACDDNGEFVGFVGNAEHIITHFAYHHFPEIDWTVEIDEEYRK